jgi:hypothetical protein
VARPSEKPDEVDGNNGDKTDGGYVERWRPEGYHGHSYRPISLELEKRSLFADS